MDPSQDCNAHASLPWVHRHVKQAPPIFRVFWGCSTVATIVVFIAVFHSIRQHFREGEKLRRAKGLVFLPRHARLHIQILALFPILSFTSWLSLFIIRQALLLELLAYLYNMACLFWFFELLIELMGGPERALALLRKEPPFKVYQVPPLMCWNIFARRKRFDLTEFRLTRALLCQYAIMGPFIAVTDALNESYLNILHYLRILVTLLCMWGLVMVFRASKQLLADFRTPLKYLTVQMTVFLVNFTSLILGFVIPGHDDIYDQSVMSEAWVHFIFCMAMLPLGLLASYSYRADELWLREEKLLDSKWSPDTAFALADEKSRPDTPPAAAQRCSTATTSAARDSPISVEDEVRHKSSFGEAENDGDDNCSSKPSDPSSRTVATENDLRSPLSAESSRPSPTAPSLPISDNLFASPRRRTVTACSSVTQYEKVFSARRLSLAIPHVEINPEIVNEDALLRTDSVLPILPKHVERLAIEAELKTTSRRPPSPVPPVVTQSSIRKGQAHSPCHRATCV